MRRGLVIVVVAIAALLAACQEGDVQVAAGSELVAIPDEVADAGTSARIGGVEVRVDGSAWRDLQPYAGGGGLPRCAHLCAEADVRPVGGELPAEVTIEELWAVRADGAGDFLRLRVTGDAEGLVITGRRGPKTDPGTSIELVVVLAAGDDRFLVRSPAVVVEEAQ